MRRLIGRFRVLLPPSTYVVMYAVLYLATSLPLIVAVAAGGNVAPVVAEKFRNTSTVIHLGFMMAYGVYRATAFHPFFRTGYRRWLETTPWSWGKPLPVGPAHPVPEDALIIAAAGLPLWLGADVHPITSYAVALAAYLAALSPTFARTGAWGFQFAVPFGLGVALMLAAGRPESYGAAVLASWAVAMIGVRRSLRRWPWVDVPTITVDPNKGIIVERKTPPLGWPFDRLGPRAEPPPGPHEAPGKVLGSLVYGWWCYAIGRAFGPESQVFVALVLGLNMVGYLSAARLMRMLLGYAPPISLAGRVARLRPLIPSYDQVFLTPFAAFFVVSAGPFALAGAGVPIDAAIATSAGLAMMTLSLGGPDLRAWQLTARHRVVPGISGAGKAGEFVRTG